MYGEFGKGHAELGMRQRRSRLRGSTVYITRTVLLGRICTEVCPFIPTYIHSLTLLFNEVCYRREVDLQNTL